MGTLFVVATPIGNLEDLSPRASRVLAAVDLIASEDTRHTGLLLRRLGIKSSQLSLHAFNEASRIDQVLSVLEWGDVALVTDAGTPGVSDPGALLVGAAADAGYPIVPVPGASALTAAMSVAGFPSSDVIFLGFLPRKAGERRGKLASSIESGTAVFLFEAPSRIATTLGEIAQIEADRALVVCRELTKLHEEINRGTAAALAFDYGNRERVRGEFVVGIAPRSMARDCSADLDALLAEAIQSGEKPTEIARRLAAITGVSRSDVYDRIRELRASDPR